MIEYTEPVLARGFAGQPSRERASASADTVTFSMRTLAGLQGIEAKGLGLTGQLAALTWRAMLVRFLNQLKRLSRGCVT